MSGSAIYTNNNMKDCAQIGHLADGIDLPEDCEKQKRSADRHQVAL